MSPVNVNSNIIIFTTVIIIIIMTTTTCGLIESFSNVFSH